MDGQIPSYIGLDFGGTKLLLGEMDAQGKLLRTQRQPTGPMDQESACRLMEAALEDFLSRKTAGCRPRAIGIGLAVHVDGETGQWLDTDAGRMQTIPLAARIRARFGLDCFLENDVKSAAKAEMLFGCGRGSRHFVYINVGTGIAAATVTGGRMVRGGHANAGEVGHISSGLERHIRCICGREDCVELIASGSGLSDRARFEKAHAYPSSKLTIPAEGRVDAREIFKLYGEDELCTMLTDDAARALANLVMNMVRFSDPDTVVLGGGVVADGFLLEKAKAYFSAHTLRYVTGGIRLSALDSNTVGLLGACANALMGERETEGQRI